MQTIQAKWYQRGSANRARNYVVLHSMEAPNKPETAEGVGHFFANLPSSNKASAHVGADMNSLCRYVSDDDIAYGAPPRNSDGLHLELAGFARYLAGDWQQPQMMAMIQLAVPQVREWCDRYGIPQQYRDAAALRRGERGITTHNEVSRAWGVSTHTDPGPGFPIGYLLAMLAAQQAPPPADAGDMSNFFYVSNPVGSGFWLVKRTDGGVFAYGDAKPIGGLPQFHDLRLQAPIVAAAPYVRDGQVLGMWLLGNDGGVFALEQAPFTTSYAAHAEWHIPNDFVDIEQRGEGYVLTAVEQGSDPPKIHPYDCTKRA